MTIIFPYRYVAHGAAHAKPDRLGCGQHSGFGRFERSPFMMKSGVGFTGGTIRNETACVINVAPTALAHLGLDCSAWVDGEPLQHQA